MPVALPDEHTRPDMAQEVYNNIWCNAHQVQSIFSLLYDHLGIFVDSPFAYPSNCLLPAVGEED
jgi:hypothetical protein